MKEETPIVRWALMATHSTIPQRRLTQPPNQVTFFHYTLFCMENFPSQNMQWVLCRYLINVNPPTRWYASRGQGPGLGSLPTSTTIA